MPLGGSQAQKIGSARLRRSTLLFLLGTTLAGCSSTLSSMPTQLGGLPADAPARPEAQPAAYPAVHDMPPPRPNTVMTAEQLKKAEAELVAIRDRGTKAEAKAEIRAETKPKTR
jgi:hypothetical protein